MATPHAQARSPKSTPSDITAVQVAGVYAEAIVEAADRNDCRDEVVSELTRLVDEVVPQVPNLVAVLHSPRVSATDKAAVIRRSLAERVTPTTLNTLLVLADHGRLGILPEVVWELRREIDRRAGRREAVVTTASPVEPDDQPVLLESIERSLGLSLAARFTVNPDLLGGLVVRVEDTVYDQSVATGLVRLAERLKQRSIHEIQHRRDRLGSA